MVAFDQRVGVAMAAQVERVNRATAPINVEDDLRQQLRVARRRILDLEDQLAEALSEREPRAKSAGALEVKGRFVMTMADAAKVAGVSIATVSRYCNQGRWESTKVGGRVLIFADQSLVKKENGRRQHGK
jgi:hypothetical protein